MAEKRTPDPVELGAYFDLIEVVALLRHQVEQQLREEAGLSYVQFQVLARLTDSSTGSQSMTELADGLVYSRSGLTYQAGLLERAGLITRATTRGDERGVTVTITPAGRDMFFTLLSGHIRVVDRLFYSALPRRDLTVLASLLATLREHMRRMPPRSATPRASSTRT